MIDTFAAHEPVLVHFDHRHSTPAEVCGTCSCVETGVWVPVPMCPVAAANQLPEGALCPNSIVLAPRCPACGRRELMEPWTDEHGSGWQCLADDCQNLLIDGEIE